MNIKWNAENYSDNFSFVYEYGEELTGMFTLGRGSRIADVGCGSGALTKKLCDMGYEVIGIDSSAEMLSLAKSTAPAASFMLADAAKFSLEKPADGIFSNAVFHWIDDLSALAKNLAANLRASWCASSAARAVPRPYIPRSKTFLPRAAFHTAARSTFSRLAVSRPCWRARGSRPYSVHFFPAPRGRRGRTG